MKAESVIKPKKFTIDKVGDTAIVSLFNNIKKVTRTVERKKEEVYEYDYYQLKVLFRDNLEADVDTNFAEWLQMAVQQEEGVEVVAPNINDRVEMLEDTINFLLGL